MCYASFILVVGLQSFAPLFKIFQIFVIWFFLFLFLLLIFYWFFFLMGFGMRLMRIMMKTKIMMSSLWMALQSWRRHVTEVLCKNVIKWLLSLAASCDFVFTDIVIWRLTHRNAWEFYKHFINCWFGNGVKMRRERARSQESEERRQKWVRQIIWAPLLRKYLLILHANHPGGRTVMRMNNITTVIRCNYTLTHFSFADFVWCRI